MNKIWRMFIESNALRITLIYILVGILWVWLSDSSVALFVSEPEAATILSIIKGWLFVAITGCMIYGLIFQSQKALKKQNQALSILSEERLVAQEELRQQLDELFILDEKIKRQNMVLTSLHEMTLGLMNRLDLTEVLKIIADSATKLIDTKHGQICLIDEEQGIFTRTIGVGVYTQLMGQSEKLTEGLIGQVYQTGEIRMIDDYSSWQQRLPQPFFDQLHYTIELPLKTQSKVVGTLGLSFTETNRQLGQREIDLLVRFSEFASIALDNAKLVTTYKNELVAKKQLAERLAYLSFHDSMTGLYNRAYFEEEMERIEKAREMNVGIVICDVDGLKLVNDTLGHSAGDEILKAVATVLQQSFRQGDLIVRIGGDEFAAIIYSNNPAVFKAACERIQKITNEYNGEQPVIPLRLSSGFAVSQTVPVDMQALFEEADNNMYRTKMDQHESTKNIIVQGMMNALEARDIITVRQSERLQNLLLAFALFVGIIDKSSDDLCRFAHFHDIGNVGIADSILLKPGKLSQEESVMVQRHSEVGYRIASAVPDLASVADWILKHHEWWNGKGYPLGTKGVAIPIECRLFAIVDAYDAMTNNRPYRKALDKKTAIIELRKCAGTQFDPNLIEPFIQCIGMK